MICLEASRKPPTSFNLFIILCRIHPDASGDNSDSPISPPIPSNPSTPGLNTPNTATTTW